MDYLSVLHSIHDILHPNNYLEIGCRLGSSLCLSNCQSIAVDPDFEINKQLIAPTRIFKMTSDQFFQQYNLKQLFGNPVDLSFIDGMHNAEFVIRDFINIEKHSHPGTVILIDDVLPENLDWTTRERLTQAWTGDVYQVIPILRQYRPDLNIYVLDVDMKGMALITGVDPASNVLSSNYPIIEKAILSDEYKVDSAMSIRSINNPISTDTLHNLLLEINKFRTSIFSQCGSFTTHIDTRFATMEFLYMNLLKASLLNEIYLDNELRLLYLRSCLEGFRSFNYSVYHDIKDHLPDEYQTLREKRHIGKFYDQRIQNAGFAHSMMGHLRMDNLHECLKTIKQENIQGDFIECGVWRGGGTIFMAGFLYANGLNDRKVFAADSFEGLPVPSLEQDKNLNLSKELFPELSVSLEAVQNNFNLYGLLNDQVVFLKGWFHDTLGDSRINQLALLRLDGDLYKSTMDSLSLLYDKVVPGGFIIVDDYGIINCRKAVDDFFSMRNVPMPNVHNVDWTGVYWRKP